MSIDLDIRSDIKQTKALLKKISKKAIPRITARALNETATAHRNTALKEVAKKLRLPQRNVTARFTLKGEKKADRATIRKANKHKHKATIHVYNRGIPVVQLITTAQKRKALAMGNKLKGGIKAKGGRRYGKVFLARPRSGSHVMTFARLGKKRYPVGVPKVGVRKLIIKEYDRDIEVNGRITFKKRFERLIRHEISKAQARR